MGNVCVKSLAVTLLSPLGKFWLCALTISSTARLYASLKNLSPTLERSIDNLWLRVSSPSGDAHAVIETDAISLPVLNASFIAVIAALDSSLRFVG